jgi:uncharacterized membrane protein YagU involved in acid resistance
MNFRETRWLHSPLVLVAAGGLLAATLDILYACVFWAMQASVPPRRILQSVAAGLLGESSFRGGNGTAALGLFLHYLIALAMAWAYYAIARQWPQIRRRWIVAGMAYGLGLYAAMQFVVVPLSRAGSAPQDTLWIVLSIVAHVVLVGMPIAWFCGRASPDVPTPPLEM